MRVSSLVCAPADGTSARELTSRMLNPMASKSRMKISSRGRYSTTSSWSPWPDDVPVDGNRGDHAWLDRHSPSALGRQQLLGLEVANSQEDQLAVLDSREAHAAEAHLGGATAILGEDDLIGRQGDLGPVSEDDRRPRGTVLEDWQRRHDLRLAGDAGA